MPASEQTFHNQKLLHVVFAIAGVALLVSTIWMFSADHMREWKGYQRDFRGVELQVNLWRQASAKEEQLHDHAKLSAAVLMATSQSIDAQLLEQFRAEVKRDDETSKVGISFAAIDGDVAELIELAKAANEKRADADSAAKGEDRAVARDAEDAAIGAEQAASGKHARIVRSLRRIVSRARFREDMAERTLKFTRAEFDTKNAQGGLAVRDGLPGGEREAIQAQVEQLKSQVQDVTLRYQDANAHRKELDRIVRLITADEDRAAKALADNRAALDKLEADYRSRRSTFFAARYPGLGKRFLELPILDAFGSPLKIETLWDEDNTINYNFVYVRRFDRCTTCHQAMQKTLPGTSDSPAYVKEKYFDLVLSTPSEGDLPEPRQDESGQPLPLTLADVYGIRVESWRVFSEDKAAVTSVQNDSLGAQAELASGELSLLPYDSEEIRNAGLSPDLAAWEEFAAARSGLLLGDVIEKINGDSIQRVTDVERMLLESVQWGEPVTLRIRRGMKQPFATHPRLDLFVGDLSPHPMQGFGCTACHGGQGSATAFKWASHTPDNPIDHKRWSSEHNWFDNHHWIFPQHPRRFMESGCLKCHHEVTELEPSERFPDPPAPKVVQGYRVIQKYGCFGCHEINGYDGPDKRVGPDMRAEPNFFTTALQLQIYLPDRFAQFAPDHEKYSKQLDPLKQGYFKLEADKEKLNAERTRLAKTDPQGSAERVKQLDEDIAKVDGELGKLTEEMAPLRAELGLLDGHLGELKEVQQLAGRLSRHPEDDDARHRLRQLFVEDKDREGDKYGQTFSSDLHRFADPLKDIESPGKFRKVGPSLRYADHKMDGAFLYDWIRNPLNFRPELHESDHKRPGTRMPRVFGLWDHLHEEKNSLHASEDFEPIEILGIVTYLQERSQSFDYLPAPSGIAESSSEEKVTRGKMLFQTRGCLACHTHKDFPDADEYRSQDEIVQGPDLSRIADKLAGMGTAKEKNGRRWLYSWIKQPSRYHARTLMPDLFLDPITVAVNDDQGKPKVTGDNKPVMKRIDPADDIVDFLLASSSENWKPKADTLTALDEETHLDLHNLTLEHLKGAFYEKRAEEYVETGIPESKRDELKGPEKELLGKIGDRERLLYVGRKSIAKYGCYGCHDIPGFEDSKPIGTTLADWGRKDTSKLAFGHIMEYLEGHGDGHGHDSHDSGEHDFYREALAHGHRSGFLNQKLVEPRSYDYQSTENIGYNDRLRMPQFSLSDADREAVATFVLGLVAEPPEEKFVYRPEPREAAIQQGQRVLAKYNCGSCHILELDKWKITYRDGDFKSPSPETTYPFLKPHFTPEELKASATPDRRGMLHSTLVGMPFLEADGRPLVNDDGIALQNGEAYVPSKLGYPFVLWEPTTINGHGFEVGGNPLNIQGSMIEKKYPSRGGMLAKYLLPHVIEMDQLETGAASKGGEALGWLPPPLHAEGEKVKSDWLHEFLLNPYPIRPAVVLRMPKFNMSSQEATQLVNYFAAVSDVDYPYQYEQQKQPEPQATAVSNPPYERAMNIVTSPNGCVLCHIVNDFVPSKGVRGQAPDLSVVDRRLRKDYMRRWIAFPKLILPYPTAMTNIIPYDPNHAHLGGVSQDLYPGTSVEQLDAVVDLLNHYDEYAKRKKLIRPLVPKTPAPTAGAAE